MAYKSHAVPFVRADDGSKDVIYLGADKREYAIEWLAAQTKYCAKILPANQTQKILQELGERATTPSVI